MTPAERAQAYEVEAAHVLDRLTRHAVADMPPSELAEKFVRLVVEAAVARIEGARQAQVMAEIMAHPAYQAHVPQNRCHASGVAGICYLPYGHDGDHTFR